jgi:hypothetical protein
MAVRYSALQHIAMQYSEDATSSVRQTDLLGIVGDEGGLLLWYLSDEHLGCEDEGSDGCSVLDGIDGNL